MTIGEILIDTPIALIFMILIFITIIGFLFLISGLPFLIMNLYRNYRNKDRISFRKILKKTYF